MGQNKERKLIDTLTDESLRYHTIPSPTYHEPEGQGSRV